MNKNGSVKHFLKKKAKKKQKKQQQMNREREICLKDKKHKNTIFLTQINFLKALMAVAGS